MAEGLFDFLNKKENVGESKMFNFGLPETGDGYSFEDLQKYNGSSFGSGTSAPLNSIFNFGSVTPQLAGGPNRSGGHNFLSGFKDSFIGTKDKPGFAGPLFAGLQGLSNLYFGKKGLDLAKDSLNTSKQQFSDQFGLQKSLINMDIRDKSEKRHHQNPTLNPDPNAYYLENKIA